MNASPCHFDQQWKSDCHLRISKLGDVIVKSKFDFCTAPPLLDMSVQVEQHTWKLSFVASNRRESRIIGLEYWPLRLHMNFFESELTPEGGQMVVGCLESLKNGEELCFLNSTTTVGPGMQEAYAPCQLSEGAISSTPSIIILCLLLTILMVAFSVGSFVWWRRRESSRRLLKHRLETCVPPLPQSKPYTEDLHRVGSKSSVFLCSRSRTHLNPITEEEPRHTVSPEDFADSGLKIPLRWRESKLIQTSLPSLEAAQHLIVDSAASSGHCSENSSSCQEAVSPNALCQATSDKQKLICSSSSSESSV